jgi:hypothetical protein
MKSDKCYEEEDGQKLTIENIPLAINSSSDSAMTPFLMSLFRSIILYGLRLCISRTVTRSSELQDSIVSARVRLGRKLGL